MQLAGRRDALLRAARGGQGMMRAACIACVLALAAPVRAVTLLEAWHAAEEHDPDFMAARAAHDAASARRGEGRALWLPNVTATATAGRMSSESDVSGAHFSAPRMGASDGVDFATSVNDGNATDWSITARQPIWSGERSARRRQIDLAADAADLQWNAARQDLMVRTVQRYFDVVAALESLRVLREQQAAADEALGQAQERYRVGDVPVTDSHEARARAETLRADVLAAETELQLKQAALEDLTGVAPADQHLEVPAEDAPAGAPGALQGWLERSAHGNPELQAQEAGVAAARQDVERTRAVSAPSLDLVARAARDRVWGNGDFGYAANSNGNGMIGLQITIPVFTGGYRSAQHEEALDMAEKARADEARARQQVALQTRSAWLGLTVGAQRVQALAQARAASLDRLEATRLGVQVGDRTTLDLLNAQGDAASAELNLVQARLELVRQRLRLAALAGALDEEALRTAGAALRPAPAGFGP